MSHREYIIAPEVMASQKAERIVEVIIDSAALDLDRPFHYELPAGMEKTVEIGSVVLVPFNRRLAVAYVVGFPDRAGVPSLKPVSSVLDEPPLFDFDRQRLCRWIASHYMCPLSRAFKLLMPPGRARKVRQVVVLDADSESALRLAGDGPLREVVETLTASGREADMATLKNTLGPGPAAAAVRELESLGVISKRFELTRPAAKAKTRLAVRSLATGPDDERIGSLPRRQRDVLEQLLALGGVAFQSELLRSSGAGSATVKSLAARGLVRVDAEEVQRLPRTGDARAERHVPDERQRAAIDEISGAVERGIHREFLLHGVTGSGKTEVYLQAIERVLAGGKQAIVLVPEISLTPQTVERFESRFPGRVAVLHSKLSPGERFDQWRGVREGRYPVVVGARSALFAPVSDLGLIAIDEEHEPSYKSDTSPRYHAREVAQVMARMAGAVLVLGSATPSFESVAHARSGRYRLLALPGRIDDRPMPDVEVVDMRKAGGAGEVPLLSHSLLDGLSRTLESGGQAILFLNRRGFANYLQCRACGAIPGCDGCDVSFCYHSRGRMLLCHHCGARRPVPPGCPECGAGPLKQFGAGTQKVEEELLSRLPGVSCVRMDADTTSAKDAHWRLLGSFAAGEARVLIGTQMIAKGLDIPGVTLVGVINADTALALPDFRASERTYQLLTQVSGRAGRGMRPGRVIVQTFMPDHPAIRALTGDVESFVNSELEARAQALYPPYVQAVNVLITSEHMQSASRGAERLRHVLETDLQGTGTIILGPAPAPLSRLRGLYRWHIVIKSADLDSIAGRLRGSMARFGDYARTCALERDVRVSLDVDPVSLL